MAAILKIGYLKKSVHWKIFFLLISDSQRVVEFKKIGFVDDIFFQSKISSRRTVIHKKIKMIIEHQNRPSDPRKRYIFNAHITNTIHSIIADLEAMLTNVLLLDIPLQEILNQLFYEVHSTLNFLFIPNSLLGRSGRRKRKKKKVFLWLPEVNL